MGPLSSLQVVKFSRVAISNSKKNVERGRVLIEPLWLRDVAIDKQALLNGRSSTIRRTGDRHCGIVRFINTVLLIMSVLSKGCSYLMHRRRR